MAKATVAPTRKPAPKSTPAKKQRYRIDTNVIALEATLRSCDGILQEVTESPARFEVGDVVMDNDGDLMQIALPYAQYNVTGVGPQEGGPRYGYGCMNIEDDGRISFCRAGHLRTPSTGSVRHLRAV